MVTLALKRKPFLTAHAVGDSRLAGADEGAPIQGRAARAILPCAPPGESGLGTAGGGAAKGGYEMSRDPSAVIGGRTSRSGAKPGESPYPPATLAQTARRSAPGDDSGNREGAKDEEQR
jgi:hypothetical protein